HYPIIRMTQQTSKSVNRITVKELLKEFSRRPFVAEGLRIRQQIRHKTIGLSITTGHTKSVRLSTRLLRNTMPITARGWRSTEQLQEPTSLPYASLYIGSHGA